MYVLIHHMFVSTGEKLLSQPQPAYGKNDFLDSA